MVFYFRAPDFWCLFMSNLTSYLQAKIVQLQSTAVADFAIISFYKKQILFRTEHNRLVRPKTKNGVSLQISSTIADNGGITF